MAIHDLSRWQHTHAFDPGDRAAERRTWTVVAITFVTMVAEIVAGIATGSMALLADGWHMATHVVALSIAGFAYLFARRLAGDPRFAFGTWKIEVLGAFASALLLAILGRVDLITIWITVLIAIGLTSCLTIPAALPLLLYWIKPEAKAWFGRT